MDINKKTILVVDDSINSDMLSVMIADVYNVINATDGRKGLEILRNDDSISLVILDMNLTYMNGIEVLIEAKNDPSVKNIPFIVLASTEDNEAECLTLGAVDFIKKPLPLRNVVLAKIENALNSENTNAEYELDRYINTLFSEYQTVYLIDVDSESYESFSEDKEYRKLKITEKGDNFFDSIIENAKAVVFEDDYELVVNTLNKESLMASFHAHQSLSMDYRLMIDGKPKHYRLKAMLVPDETPQIIIGVASTEEEVVGMETLLAYRNDVRHYADIAQSLASDYMCIYYVHLESNRFVEYMSDADYGKLRLEKSGDNFFTFGLKSFLRGVNPVDKDRVTRLFTKENILKAIDEHKAFTLQFRITFEESDEYVCIKATKLVNDGVDYLVVGLSNIDAQVNAE